ncbi:MAG: NfeD family protein [Bacteroidales bacterium]|jgi:membrane-bound ClpP family serine protease|nr:NfeD family protein [Bacteroidales bacterium]
MNWIGILILIVIGIVALILDFLVIPGAFVSIIGGCFILAGIIMSYVLYGVIAGNIVLFATIALTVLAIVLTLRSKTWKRLVLNTEIDSKMNEIDASKIAVGMRGVTISRLAPAGKAQFGDEYVEVTSPLGFADPQTPIEITHIEGSKIIVKLIHN